jgi:hypothetical protein
MVYLQLDHINHPNKKLLELKIQIACYSIRRKSMKKAFYLAFTLNYA